ncbi:MAG: DUF4188 domain-containing protein [Thermomicrobiales bacterium]
MAASSETTAEVGQGAVIRGRYIATPPAGTVIFMFGLRVNRWSELRRWLPLWRSLRRIVREQHARPQCGLLWSTSWRDGREFTVLQYWKDMQTLLDYAQDPSFKHAGVWKKYNHGVGDTGLVGIWHEAYTIDTGSPKGLHTIYRDVPSRGLAAATSSLEGTEYALRELARKRSGKEEGTMP